MEFKIADLLKTTDIKGIRLVAGATGVENVISRTNILDNPDTYDWLIAGELVLSTGYIFRDDEEMQRTIVRRLAEIRCSGLGIKIMRYLKRIPPCMIEEAEILGLPLIEFPFGHSLSMITDSINSHLFAQGQSRPEQALAVHRELAKIVMRSGSLREMARVTAGFIRNPILIMDSGWRLLEWAEHPGNPYPLKEHLDLRFKAKALPDELLETLPDSLDIFHKPIARQLSLKNGDQVLCRIVPINAYETTLYGFIVVWETLHTLETADYLTLEQTVISIAMERMRARELDESKLKIRRDFFDDLLAGNIGSLSAIRSLATLHGLHIDSSYRCVLVRLAGDPSEHYSQDQARYDSDSKRISNICIKASQEEGIPLVCIPYMLQTILLVEQPHTLSSSPTRLPLFIELLAQRLREAFAPQIPRIIVSAPALDLTRVADTFADVRQTMRLVEKMGHRDPINYVEDFAVHHLLEKNIERSELLYFANRALGKLQESDQTSGAQLTETLDAYFRHQGNITNAARELHIHRNTYIYRLDKIKNILANDLSNPQKLLEYQLALVCLQIGDSL
jgi:purine catabolism regulator